MSTEFTLSCYYWTSLSKEDLPLYFRFQVCILLLICHTCILLLICHTCILYFRFQVRKLAAGAEELVQSLLVGLFCLY